MYIFIYTHPNHPTVQVSKQISPGMPSSEFERALSVNKRSSGLVTRGAQQIQGQQFISITQKVDVRLGRACHSTTVATFFYYLFNSRWRPGSKIKNTVSQTQRQPAMSLVTRVNLGELGRVTGPPKKLRCFSLFQLCPARLSGHAAAAMRLRLAFPVGRHRDEPHRRAVVSSVAYHGFVPP